MSTLNAEDEERTFNAICNISRDTSSRRPSEIVGNNNLRFQAEAAMHGKSESLRKQESSISKFAIFVTYSPNTIFEKDFIKRDRHDYQAHLQRISDFLLPGERIW